jgi:hypothetical protein
MDDMPAAEMRRRNLGITDDKPYVPGQKNIPEAQFNRKLVPLCIECKKVTVDFWIYQGSVDMEFFCGDACEDKHRRRREREQEAQSRQQMEYLKGQTS